MKKILIATTCLFMSNIAVASNLPTYDYEYTLTREGFVVDYMKGSFIPSGGNTVVKMDGVELKTKYNVTNLNGSGNTDLKSNILIYISSDGILTASHNSNECGQIEFKSKELPLLSTQQTTSPKGCLFDFNIWIHNSPQ